MDITRQLLTQSRFIAMVSSYLYDGGSGLKLNDVNLLSVG